MINTIKKLLEKLTASLDVGAKEKQMSSRVEFLAESLAWKKIKNGAFVLDVRSQSEAQSGTLPGAVVIRHTELANHLGSLPAIKSSEIVCYCARGGRSEIAKQFLIDHGYTAVFNAGGYQSLKAYADQNGL